MRRPATNSLIDWIGAATEDLADNVARINQHLDTRETDPRWGRKVWQDSWELISLRRWAFLLPGGGALRGGRKPQPIPPATARQKVTATPAAETTPAAPVEVSIKK